MSHRTVSWARNSIAFVSRGAGPSRIPSSAAISCQALPQRRSGSHRTWTSAVGVAQSGRLKETTYKHLAQKAHASRNRNQSRSLSASRQAGPTRQCPSCSATIPLAACPCPQCSALLPLPPGLSHFALLSLSDPIPYSSPPSPSEPYDVPAELASLPARGFDLDPRDARARMLGRQKDLHPDRYAVHGEKQVALAKELSGQINKAYDVLASPLKRAEYILEVHGRMTEETDSLTDPELLAEILEAREELEEAESSDQVDRLRELNHDKVEAAIAALSKSFSAEPPDLSEAKSLAVQLKYWLGLEAAAKEWQPGKGAAASAGSAFTHS